MLATLFRGWGCESTLKYLYGCEWYFLLENVLIFFLIFIFLTLKY